MINGHTHLIGKFGGDRLVWRSRLKWGNNIK
jgi:hypothetical protein